MGRNFPRKNLEKGILSKLGLFQTPGAEHRDVQWPSGISLLSETKELLNPIPPARIPASSRDISGTSKHFSHFSMTTTLQPSNPKQEEPRTGGIQPFLPGYPKNPRHHELLATPAPKRNEIFFCSFPKILWMQPSESGSPDKQELFCSTGPFPAAGKATGTDVPS